MKRIATLLLLLALLPAAAFAQSFSTVLSGGNEVPSGDTDGVGFAVVTFDGTTVRYSVFTQNIAAPTMAHIHRGVAGVNGPIVIDFNAATLTNGTATTTQALASEIIANPSGFYVNVHTADFPGGAVRGQLAGATEAGVRTAFLPVVGKVTGANNTNFVTDLRIINHGAGTANVTLDFFATSAAGQTAPTATKSVTVAPGEQKVLDDVVGATLATSGLGALRVVSDQNVTVTARVINDLRSTNLGTTGFAVASGDDATTAGTISFLSQGSLGDIGAGVGFRTNVGYFNPSASPATVTFTARRTSDGSVLGSNTVTIPGFSMVQQGAFTLLTNVPDADRTQSNFYVTWTSTAPVFVYGAVVDNKTGDSVLIQ